MQITNNNFSKGINSDIEERYQGNDSYRDAENITITGEGGYLTATNISGSKLVSRIIDSSIEADYVNVLGAFECTGSYSSYGDNVESNASIVMFVYWETPTLDMSDIYLYDIVKDKLHLLIRTNANAIISSDRHLNFDREGTIDAVILGENGIDNIYFDDHNNVLRKLEITDKAIESSYLLSHVRYAPIDTISFENILENSGELGCGSYQFAYQYYNTETKKETTYSLFTNPVDIVPVDFSKDTTVEDVYGGVPNEVSRKSIKLKIQKNSEESSYYDSVRLAVLKNNIGSDRANPTVYLTEFNKDWFTNGDIFYDGSGLEIPTDLSEIVVDDAPISNAKTLTTKDGVLFRGNVNYFDRKIKDVEFDSAETISKNIGYSAAVIDYNKLNTNNPYIDNGPTTNTDSPNSSYWKKQEYLNEEVKPNVARAIKSSFDIAEGTIGGGSGDGIDVANLIGYTKGSYDLIIGNDLEPGNVFRVVIRSFPFGLRRRTDGQWEVLKDALQVTNRFWVDGVEYTGEENYPEGYDADVNISYTIKQGDTPTSVAKIIYETIQANLTTSNVSLDDEVGVALENDKIRLTPKAPENYKYEKSSFETNRGQFLDIGYWTFKGTSTVKNATKTKDLLSPSNFAGGYVNPNNSCKYRGYFRNEVYRFGITYMDEFGNWSNPVPFDFSEQNVYKDKSNDSTHVSNVTWDSQHGLVRFGFINSSVVKPGDVIRYEDSSSKIDGHYLATDVGSEYAMGEPMFLDFDKDNVDNNTGDKKIFLSVENGSFANTGTDWKFPTRNNRKFPLLDADGINALGISIKGIKNVPEWAKAYSIVRVRRLKDIVWQSPHITAIAVMPSVLPDESCNNGAGSPSGTIIPKSFSHGIARNIERSSYVISTVKDVAGRQRQTRLSNNIMPISVCVPPEYMYQLDNINYGSGLTPSSTKLKIIDAITLVRSKEFEIDNTAEPNNGTSVNGKTAIALRADSQLNHYYRNNNGLKSFSFWDMGETGHFEEGNDNNVLNYGEVTKGGTAYTFPSTPNPNLNLRSVITFGDADNVAKYNCSPYSFVQQKSLVLTLDKTFGDLTYMSSYSNNSDNTVTSEIQFNETGGNYSPNIGDSSFSEPSFFTDLNKIAEFNDNATCSTPIVNLVRGIEDDRYGLKSEVLQYIHTGTYGVITDPYQPIDVEVFGGDCFISKHTVRTSETTLIPFAESLLGDNKVQAYSDFYEVISCYVESVINCQLQSNPYVYPVVNKSTVGEFETDYTYPYNPGYSVENEAKTWTSLSLGDANRTKFPARMIYSDQKIFQTDEEGFNRFRVSSLYDFPEEYGGLTKITKVASDNVYVIQDEAVCVVPINKNVIEDASSNQMIINSSTLINKPQYFLNENGSQHIRSVINTDDTIIFMDAQKRSVIKIAGGQSERISDNGKYSDFHTALESNTKIPDKDIIAGYDFNNKEYFIGVNTFKDKVYNDGGSETEVDRKGFLYVWSDKVSAWTTSIVPSEDTKIHSIIYSNSELYIIGNDKSNSLDLENFYGSDIRGVILGETVPSKITFVINPNVSFGKTFDNIRLDSNNRVDSCDMVVIKEDGTVDQTATMNCNVKPRHDAYEFPILRDSKNARLRGKYAITTFTINNGTETSVSIAGVITKYRTSKNNFIYGATR